MRWWRGLRGEGDRKADLERELRPHLDLEAEERESGVSRHEVLYAAQRALGNRIHQGRGTKHVGLDFD